MVVMGFEVGRAGDINGDGFDDVMVRAWGVESISERSGPNYAICSSRNSGSSGELPENKGTDGDDTLKGSKIPEHFIAVDGNDALHLTGSNLNLDLTTLADRIHGVETICLCGRGDNALMLTADSLLNLSDSTNTLKVHGNSSDHI